MSPRSVVVMMMNVLIAVPPHCLHSSWFFSIIRSEAGETLDGPGRCLASEEYLVSVAGLHQGLS